MYRVALGYDLHRLQKKSSGFVVCAGVEVPCEFCTEGAHSDGDVVYHALTDALLSLSGTDIGQVFPNIAPENHLRDSQDFLQYAKNTIKNKYNIANIDIVIICDSPKISPHALEMKNKISAILGTEDISIRGKTTENTRPLTIECYCNVLFKKITE